LGVRLRHFIAYGLVACLLAGAGLLGFRFFEVAPLSPDLETPKRMLAAARPELRGRPLFFTPEVLPFLREWKAAFGEEDPKQLVNAFEAALQSPPAWRALDRKWRFGAVILAGDPAGFRPLLEHLRRSPDWTLTRMDPTGYFFERSPAEAWTVEALPSALEAFRDSSPREQQFVRLQLAHRLMYWDDLPAALALLEEVLAEAPKSPEAWTQMAAWHGMAGQWNESLAAAQRALKAKSNYFPARVAQAQALVTLGRFGEALILTRPLFAAASDHPQVLLLHARASRGAHAYHEEVEVLRRLIDLLEGRSQPVSVWRVYLGQAYSATGSVLMAEAQFRAALADPELGEAERTFATKALEKLDYQAETINTELPTGPAPSLLDEQMLRL